MRDDIDRSWVRYGVMAAVAGMACWVIGIVLIPLDAQLQNGEEQLADLLRTHSSRLYVAAGLAAVGGVLLVAYLVALTQVVPAGERGGGLLRLSLAGCVVTQTLVACGAAFAFTAVHASVANVDPALVALAWRGLWLAFLVSAVPTVLFTAAAVLGLRRAGLSLGWVSGLGWFSAGAHVLVMSTLAQRGLLAPDGPIGGIAPLTTVLWVLASAMTLPGALERGSRPPTGERRAASTSRVSHP